MTNNFNPIERGLARALARFPILKRTVKGCYARLSYLLNKKPYREKTVEALSPVAPDERVETFFGYYDKLPENGNGLILLHASNIVTSQLPDPNQPISILVCHSETGDTVLEAKSNGYNWQQGTRLQWLTQDLFIFNDFDSEAKTYISRAFSVSKKTQVKEFKHPVQDAFEDRFFLSLNYQRLAALRPDYGYRNLPPLTKEQLAKTDSDGIWKVDYRTGAAELIISLDDLIGFIPKSEFSSAHHKVNHLMISPDGENFIFLHRYYNNGRRSDRLILARSNGTIVAVLADFGMVSHCCWANNQEVVAYLRGPDGQDAYYSIDCQDEKLTPLKADDLSQSGDGHPSVNGDWLLTDTYPNKARLQQLFLSNRKTGCTLQLGEFFHGFRYDGESRCDLHPRFSSDGGHAYIDSVFSGRRRMYKVSFPE